MASGAVVALAPSWMAPTATRGGSRDTAETSCKSQGDTGSRPFGPTSIFKRGGLGGRALPVFLIPYLGEPKARISLSEIPSPETKKLQLDTNAWAALPLVA